MFELLKAGGFLIWPILLCSVVALAIVIERFSSLRTSNVAPSALTERVGKLLLKGSIDLKTINEIEEHSPLGRVLGTVIGMIKVFSAITTFGVGDPQALAAGISEALVTTAAGLSVGIPSLMFHRYFRGRVNELTIDMEQQALRFMKILQRSQP